VSDSTVDCPEQSAPCPSHTFKKTAAINAIIAEVLDNTFSHLVAFRLRDVERFSKKDFRHLVRKQTIRAGFTAAAMLLVHHDEADPPRSHFFPTSR
jgi:hypothetical protein